MERKEPDNPDDNNVSDWEGADDLEQDLQDKILSNMENPEPKIENSAEKEIEMSLTYSEWEKVLTGMTAYSQELFVKEKDPETLARFEGDQIVGMLQREQEGIDEVVKKIQEKLKE